VAKIKLTPLAVERLALPDGKVQEVYWDQSLPAFGVLVGARKRSYIVQKKLAGGRTRRVNIGDVRAWTLDKARAKARAVMVEVDRGGDPKVRPTVAASVTLSEVFERYIKSRTNLKPRTVADYRLDMGYLSAWSSRLIREITPDMVEDRHAAIGRDHGGPTANSVFRVFRAVYNFAEDRDDSLPRNPARRLKRQWFSVPPRTRYVTNAQLAEFWRAVSDLQSRTGSDYLKLLLFTGLRKMEAAALRWDEVDLSDRMIHLSAQRTKASRKLDLPMSDVVASLLIARRALGIEGPWVFQSVSRSGHVEEPKGWLALVAQATGIAIAAHDLRRTFITAAESADLSETALKALVNHSLGRGVTAGYIQVTGDRLREPVQRVADKLKVLCDITSPEGLAVLRG